MLTFSFCCCFRAYCINRHLQSSPGYVSSNILSRELRAHNILHVPVVLIKFSFRFCFRCGHLSFLFRCNQHVPLGHWARTTVGKTISGISWFVVYWLVILGGELIDALVGIVSPVYRHVCVILFVPSIRCVHQLIVSSTVHGLICKVI